MSYTQIYVKCQIKFVERINNETPLMCWMH